MLFSQLSLRWQICLVTAAALSVSLVVIGWYAFVRSRAVVQEFALDKMMAETDQVAAQVKSILKSTEVNTLNTLQFPPIPGLIRCWDNTQNPGQDPLQIGSSSQDWIDRLAQILTAQMRFYPERMWCSLYRDQGEAVMQVAADHGTVDSDQLADVANEDFFLRTRELREGQVYVAPIKREGEAMVVRCCTPVYDYDEADRPQRLRGVFVIALDGERIISNALQSINARGEGPRGWIDIVDETGQYVFSNDTLNPAIPFSSHRYLDFKPVRAERLQKKSNDGSYDPQFDTYREYIPGHLRPDRVALIATYRRVYYAAPQDRRRFWAIAASEDARTAMAPVTQMGRGFLVAGLVVLVIAAAVTCLASTRLTASLRSLARAADQIASGNLGSELPAIRALGEVGILDDSFRRMTDNLRQTIQYLSHQEARTQAILDSAADSIVTIGEDGTILKCNAATERIFNLSNGDVLGRKASILCTALYDEDANYVDQPLAPGEVRVLGGEAEVRGRRPDGSQLPLALRVAEMNYAGERLFIATMRDITELKRSEIDRQRLFEAIRDAVQRLAAASQQILATTSHQATGTQEQASAVNETVATAEEMAESARQAADRANKLAESAQQTGETGTEGRKHIQDAVGAMERVYKQVQALAESIVSLAEQAQTIGEITATVNDIAEQTNVLALNAAVEAARAGEQGKGFAVVAGEVKALAEQSKKATAQVRTILSDIRRASTQAVLATEQGSQAVSEAGKIVTRAGATIVSLADTLNASARTATQISAAINQQAVGISQLNHGIQNIDRVTEQNARAIQQIEQSARNLNALSNELASLVVA